MKRIPPSDFCRWAYPDVAPKSADHKYLVKLKNRSRTQVVLWNGEDGFYDEHNDAFCEPYPFNKIHLIMILPNSPEENDAKEP